MEKILHIVHCIDTEGPLIEDLSATFQRLKSIFNIDIEPTRENLTALQEGRINLNGLEEVVAKTFSESLLKYNENWSDINKMLNKALSENFRKQMLDDFGNGWIYSWHIMDHLGFNFNPRHKDIGYGNVFNFYREKLNETKSFQDEINWHFHPLSLRRNPLHSASSYLNNYDVLLHILCRRIIDHNWFPVVNRPGFHVERPDSHQFLESWIPFDYANQRISGDQDQPELRYGRFADWQRAPLTWRGYHPHHDDYQVEGNCRRKIFRILNVGTRHRALEINHFFEAFKEAREFGSSIIAFADHDYRDITADVNEVRNLISKARNKFPDVKIKFSGAESAIKELNSYNSELELAIRFDENRLIVDLMKGEIFGPQPFLAIKTISEDYFHDNLDVVSPNKTWSYHFDDETIPLKAIDSVGIGSAGLFGGYSVKTIKLS